ncbi:MAG: GspH/FimT family pseudopilin [Woeseiaceae bacterium]|nr:GspH/FimT family pseudopilin [Woeseiaceae bacterium]
MNNRTQNGFTLHELLITVLIAGVVMTVGIPNLLALNQNGRMTATANNIHSAFHLARSESSRAKANITVCASSSSLAATPDCEGDWDEGFIVFVDDDGDLSVDAGTDSILRVFPALDDSITLAVADDATYFSFASTGLGRSNVGGNSAVSQIVMCDERGTKTAAGGRSAARLFVVTPLGRAQIFNDNSLGTIDDALTNMGKSCP